MDWNDFNRLENQHYEMLFLRHERGFCGEMDEPEDKTAWWIDWESQEEECEDREEIVADTEEQAVEIFREEMVGNGIPDDAVIVAVKEAA